MGYGWARRSRFRFAAQIFGDSENRVVSQFMWYVSNAMFELSDNELFEVYHIFEHGMLDLFEVSTQAELYA